MKQPAPESGSEPIAAAAHRPATSRNNVVIEVERVSKTFETPRQGKVVALEDITIDVSYGEFVTVVGPSGCGKSTLLRMIAGLTPLSAGKILYQGEPVRGLNTKVGYVPQESKLFPWLTLEENVGFGLDPRRYSRKEREDRTHNFIKLAGLEGFEKHYPSQLSGGMAKRASIIRALVYEPAVILMDEPFGPLDAQTRMILQDELLKIWEQKRQTIVFVTHDLVEAVALADRVAIVTHRPGRIKDILKVPMDRPRNIFEIHRQKGFDEAYGRLWNIFRHELKIRLDQGQSLDSQTLSR
ncbi:MAG: ABC transporter ATP-binding protein [Deltaproteobacteria bacterium]|nr:ABC transporter ATP-binding protein [Deltaproteobacteria bacterium]